eukprot:GHVT01096962.1.p1 GENE.GHVT01096962.1~~GHVT01096962.1.p1  ORF type:complete len:277 (+),score=35.59 GHVT01096962.1:318-1148(+)
MAFHAPGYMRYSAPPLLGYRYGIREGVMPYPGSYSSAVCAPGGVGGPMAGGYGHGSERGYPLRPGALDQYGGMGMGYHHMSERADFRVPRFHMRAGGYAGHRPPYFQGSRPYHRSGATAGGSHFATSAGAAHQQQHGAPQHSQQGTQIAPSQVAQERAQASASIHQHSSDADLVSYNGGSPGGDLGRDGVVDGGINEYSGYFVGGDIDVGRGIPGEARQPQAASPPSISNPLSDPNDVVTYVDGPGSRIHPHRVQAPNVPVMAGVHSTGVPSYPAY